MKEQYAKYLGIIVNVGIIALVFVVPVLFIPLSQNINDARIFAEFNKQVLFILGSLTLFSLWSFRMILEKKVSIVRTPLDVPLIIFFIIYLLSTAFSTDLFVSLVGFYGLFHPSVLSVFALILFYFTLVSNINAKTRFYVIGAFLTSLLLISLINITNYLGWFALPYEAAKVREWIPLISLGTLGFLAAIATPVSLGLSLQSKNIVIKVVGLAYSLVFFTSVLIVNAFGAWVTLFAAALVFLLFSPRAIQSKQQRLPLAIMGAVVAVFIIISLTPTLRENLIQPLIKGGNNNLALVSEKRLSIEGGWQVATGAVTKKPFLGHGPATFPFSYTRFAPTSINQTEDWNIRFEQASNEYVNIVSSIGILGLMAFIFVLFSIIKPLAQFVTQSSNVQENPITIFILASLAGFVVGSLFFDTSLVIGLLFMILAALAFSTLNDLGAKGVDKVNLKLVSLNAGAIKSFAEADKPNENTLGYILFIPALVVTLAISYTSFLSVKAEVSYQESINAAAGNNAADTRDKLVSAIDTFSYRDIYHRTLSLVNLRIAQEISTQDNQTQQGTQNIQLLVQESINQGKIASGYQNPTTFGTSSQNVVNWESLASVYSALVGVANGADNHAINTYVGAIERQPKNPLLFEALGNVYLKLNRTDEAVRTLETAVSLKPDLASSRYSLAQAYKQAEGRDGDAASQLQQALNNLDENSQNRERIKNELDELNKTLQNSSTASPSASQTP